MASTISSSNTTPANDSTGGGKDLKQTVVIAAPVAGVIVLALVIAVITLLVLRRKRNRPKHNTSIGETNHGINTEITGSIEEAPDENSLDSGYSEIQECTEEQKKPHGLSAYPQHVSECEFCTIGSVKHAPSLCSNPSCRSRKPSETSEGKYENFPSDRAQVWTIGGSFVFREENRNQENKHEGGSLRDENMRADDSRDEKCLSIYYQKAMFTDDLNDSPDDTDNIYNHTNLKRFYPENKHESTNIYAHTYTRDNVKDSPKVKHSYVNVTPKQSPRIQNKSKGNGNSTDAIVEMQTYDYASVEIHRQPKDRVGVNDLDDDEFQDGNDKKSDTSESKDDGVYFILEPQSY